MPVVDIHAHHVATDLLEAAARSGDRYGVTLDQSVQPLGRLVFDDGTVIRPFFPELCDLRVRIPTMDELGVDVQVVSTWTDIAGYNLPVDQGVAWARLQNETMAGSVAEHDGRFEAMGTLPLQSVEASLDEMRFAVDELGFRSFEIGTSVNGVHIAEERFHGLWDALADYDVFVLLHPPIDPTGTGQLTDHFLKNLLGNPTDTTIAGAKLAVSGILERLPGLKVCLVHGGGFLPYQIGRLDKGHIVHPDTRRDIPDHLPSTFLESFYYDTIIYDPEALSYLAAKVTPQRLLLGSDYPFEMFDEAGIANIRGLDCSASELAGILGETALAALRRRGTSNDAETDSDETPRSTP